MGEWNDERSALSTASFKWIGGIDILAWAAVIVVVPNKVPGGVLCMAISVWFEALCGHNDKTG